MTLAHALGRVYALHTPFSGQIRRDGRNSTDELTRSVALCTEYGQLVLFQGAGLVGFNVADIRCLHAQIGRPVLAAARRRLDLGSIERGAASLISSRVPGGLSRALK